MNGVFSACSCTSLVASFNSSDRSVDILGKHSERGVSAVSSDKTDLRSLGQKEWQKKEQSIPERRGWGAESKLSKRCPEQGRLTGSIQRWRQQHAFPRRAGTALRARGGTQHSSDKTLPSHLSELCDREVSMFLHVFHSSALLLLCSPPCRTARLGAGQPGSHIQLYRASPRERAADLSASTNFLQHSSASLPSPASPPPRRQPQQPEGSHLMHLDN